jgi:HEAT repeat protein
MAALASSEEEVRWAAESALAQIGDPAIPPLIAALYNPDAQLRRAATEALSQINLPAAREALEAYWMTSWAGRH